MLTSCLTLFRHLREGALAVTQGLLQLFGDCSTLEAENCICSTSMLSDQHLSMRGHRLSMI